MPLYFFGIQVVCFFLYFAIVYPWPYYSQMLQSYGVAVSFNSFFMVRRLLTRHSAVQRVTQEGCVHFCLQSCTHARSRAGVVLPPYHWMGTTYLREHGLSVHG